MISKEWRVTQKFSFSFSGQLRTQNSELPSDSALRTPHVSRTNVFFASCLTYSY